MGIDEHFMSVNQSGREPICCGHQYVWPDTEALPLRQRAGFTAARTLAGLSGAPEAARQPPRCFLRDPSVSGRNSSSDTGPLGRWEVEFQGHSPPDQIARIQNNALATPQVWSTGQQE